MRLATGAGAELAELLARELAAGAVVIGIAPAGLVLARAVATRLALPVLAVPVMTLAPPWNAKPVYGAVAFDNSVCLESDLLRDLELGRRDLESAVARARDVLATQRARRDPVELARRVAVVIDDGGAPFIAVAATLDALRNTGAGRVVAAVGDGSCRHLQRLAGVADQVLCPRRETAPGLAQRTRRPSTSLRSRAFRPSR